MPILGSNKSFNKKIRSLPHEMPQTYTRIKCDNVRELKIKLSSQRKFKNIDTIQNIISKRRLIFIGKIIRMACKCIPVRLISTFQTNERTLDRPNITVRHSFINDIEKFISNVDSAGTFISWAHITFDEKRSTTLKKSRIETSRMG